MKKLYDICATTGQYTQGNQKRNRYLNVGAVFQDDHGHAFITLSAAFNPAGVPRQDGRDSIILNLFQPDKQKGQAQSQPQPEPAPVSQQMLNNPNDFNLDMEIPF